MKATLCLLVIKLTAKGRTVAYVLSLMCSLFLLHNYSLVMYAKNWLLYSNWQDESIALAIECWGTAI